eukprot:344739-Prymnesium_polylepis.1
MTNATWAAPGVHGVDGAPRKGRTALAHSWTTRCQRHWARISVSEESGVSSAGGLASRPQYSVSFEYHIE